MIMGKIDLFDLMDTVTNSDNKAEDMNITSAFICVTQEDPEEKGKFEMRCRATGEANFLFSSLLEYARMNEPVRNLLTSVVYRLAEEAGALKSQKKRRS